MSDHRLTWSFLTTFDLLSIASVCAAIFAAACTAFSAFMTKRSAEAAASAAEEARIARKSELLPRLVLEKSFDGIQLFWPNPADADGHPVYAAAGIPNAHPEFLLSNFATSPALEVVLVFELEDNYGELEIPEGLSPSGLSVAYDPIPDFDGRLPMLSYHTESRGWGLPLYYRMTVDLPYCAPGQTRVVPFPQGILHRIFVRGLQYRDRMALGNHLQPLVLSAKINCHTVDGERVSTQFRFNLLPFCYNNAPPFNAHCHVDELPMYPRTDEPKVLA